MKDAKVYLPPGTVKARAENPRAYFAAWRGQGKVVVDNGEKVVIDGLRTEEILNDFATFPSKGNVYYGRNRPIIPQQSDPPQHTKIRRVLAPLMSVKRMKLLEPELIARTNECIDAFIDRGSCELKQELAVPVPALSFINLLGLPRADLPFFLQFKDAVMRPLSQPGSLDEQMRRQSDFAMRGEAYFQDLLRQRRRRPGDDLISAMMAAEVSGERLSDDEIVDICFQLPLAGLDTVTSTILLGFAFLSKNPRYQEALATRPEITELAVEELLRWETPVHTLKRSAAHDMEIGGCPFKAGERVLISVGAANADKERLADADVFDIERDPNRHLAFGNGPHICVGNNLARIELRIVMREWHRRIPSYRMKPGAVLDYSDDNSIRTIAEVPLEWDRP
jgi:cytochrome P450